MFSYVVVTDSQVLSGLESGTGRSGLAIEPAENHLIGFVAIVDPEPHPLGFARLLIPNLELNVIARLVLHNLLSTPRARSGVSGFASHCLSKIGLRYRFYEIREVAMKVGVLLKPNFGLFQVLVGQIS